MDHRINPSADHRLAIASLRSPTPKPGKAYRVYPSNSRLDVISGNPP
jgi:hypothetical protein